ncbi:MAG: FlgD immunoglobulin-like domain containing protein, partial [bacterium]
AKTASLDIASDDPDENPFLIPLTGVGEELPPSSGEVTFEEIQSGGSSDVSAVSTAGSLTGVAGHVYLAAISSKPYRLVTQVSGMNGNWTQVAAQCAGRNQTGVEIWMSLDASVTGAVTATFASAPRNAVIVAARYSSVDILNPIGSVVSGNSNGENGGCSGGKDNAAYSFTLTTGVPNAAVFGAIAMRQRVHNPGLGYTERVEFIQGGGGAASSVAIVDQLVSVPSVVILDGSFDNDVDWAVAGFVIKPQAALPKTQTVFHDEIEGYSVIPSGYKLEQNYPNPFNPSTAITFSTPLTGEVTLSIYNLRGQLVQTLHSGIIPAGQHHMMWHGMDLHGATVPSGVYVYRLKATGIVLSRKLILLK